MGASRSVFLLPFFGLCLTVFFLSCQRESSPPYALPDEPERLLAGDSSKVWKIARRYNNETRMNMGDCFLSYRVTYARDQQMMDNSGDHTDCGPTLFAQWNFAKDASDVYYVKLTSEQLPALLNIDKDHKLFKVLYLAQDELILQYQHRLFSDKLTTITDIYVPGAMEIEGRDFHW